MYTASDMKEDLNKCYCDGIDDWLRDEILPRFAKMEDFTITISAEMLSSMGWDGGNWKRSMKQRGFKVEEYCTQDYFSDLRYRISL